MTPSTIAKDSNNLTPNLVEKIINAVAYQLSDRVLSLNEVEAMTKMKKSLIQQNINEGKFPQKFETGKRRVGWRFSDVQEWIHIGMAPAWLAKHGTQQQKTDETNRLAFVA